MQILASSGGQVLQFFAHAGYISAYPRALREYALPREAVDRVVDVAETLRLKGEVLGTLVPQTGLLETPGIWPWVASGAMALALGAVVLVAMRYGEHLQAMWRRARGSTVLLAGVFLFAVTLVSRAWGVGQADPWEDVERRSYLYPERATWVILQGLVEPAIENNNGEVSSLGQLKDRIGLPTTRLTEGEAYAVRTYGLDGWGNRFRLKKFRGDHLDGYRSAPSYRLTSAGKDGRFGTADDLTSWTQSLSDDDWDYSGRRKVLFMRRQGRDTYLFFHRWWGELFRFKNRRLAEKMTGSDLYDLWRVEDMELGKRKDEFKRAATRLKPDRLYLLRYKKKEE
jgi:hypothetical protein